MVKVPPPKSTPPPYTNGAEEVTTGVFTPRTGATRRMTIYGGLIAAGVALLTPIFNAIAARIAPPSPQPAFVDPELLRELRGIRDSHSTDAGEP